MFSIFKQYYTYFHTLFHPHLFLKNKNNITKITLPNGPQSVPFTNTMIYKFRWGVDPNTFYAYIVSYSVWYVGEGVLHLLGQAPRVDAKMKLQPNNGLNEF